MISIIERYNELLGGKSYLFVCESSFFEIIIEEECVATLFARVNSVEKQIWLRHNLPKMYWFMVCESVVGNEIMELESGIRKEKLRLQLRRIEESGIDQFVPVEFCAVDESVSSKERYQRVVCVFEKKNGEKMYKKTTYQADDYSIKLLPEEVKKRLSTKFYNLMVAIEEVLNEI